MTSVLFYFEQNVFAVEANHSATFECIFITFHYKNDEILSS